MSSIRENEQGSSKQSLEGAALIQGPRNDRVVKVDDGDDDVIFGESAGQLFGEETMPVAAPEEVSYGPVRCRIPAFEGKAVLVLASAFFNSGLVMTELVETGVVEVANKHILELGASTSMPSLLASTLDPPPAFILTTDYPDDLIIKNLAENVERNSAVAKCPMRSQGYLWGTDAGPLLSTLPEGVPAFTLLILADLLWLADEHDNILKTIVATLDKSAGTAYFTTGHYAKRPVVESFFRKAVDLGLAFEELQVPLTWTGKMKLDVGVGASINDIEAMKKSVWAFKLYWRQSE